jgi:hypothetical protein
VLFLYQCANLSSSAAPITSSSERIYLSYLIPPCIVSMLVISIPYPCKQRKELSSPERQMLYANESRQQLYKLERRKHVGGYYITSRSPRGPVDHRSSPCNRDRGLPRVRGSPHLVLALKRRQRSECSERFARRSSSGNRTHPRRDPDRLPHREH